MSKITVTTTPKNHISINTQQKGVVRVGSTGLTGAGSTAIRNLSDLLDVDSSDIDNNETLVYDEGTGKFVVKELPVLNGGTF
jgi:hypothetical protein